MGLFRCVIFAQLWKSMAKEHSPITWEHSSDGGGVSKGHPTGTERWEKMGSVRPDGDRECTMAE